MPSKKPNIYILTLLRCLVVFKLTGKNEERVLNISQLATLKYHVKDAYADDRLRKMFEPKGFTETGTNITTLNLLADFVKDLFNADQLSFDDIKIRYESDPKVKAEDAKPKSKYVPGDIVPIRRWAIAEIDKLIVKKNNSTLQSQNPYDQLKEKSITNILKELASGYYFQKYISKVYYDRKDANSKFLRFLNQSGQNLFVLIGRAGKGKSNLFCHWAYEQAIHPNSKNLTLILNAPELNLEKQKLENYIVDYFDTVESKSLDDISRIIKERTATQLLIFIDGINELEGANSFETFNQQMEGLLTICKERNYPVKFAISCRTDFWDIFSVKDWANSENVFESESIGNTSYEVKDFDVHYIDDIIRKYFDWYVLEGEIIGEAKIKCCDPIMLRYLCEAYTNRKRDASLSAIVEVNNIGPIQNLNRKKVFDTFVRSVTPKMQKALQAKSNSGSINKDDLYFLTTRYLLHLAKTMYENKRSYITEDEIFEVAKRLNHPDAKLERFGFTGNKKSVVFTFIDEAIILAKRTEKQFDFVFESYFEYSLGRFFALERWLRFKTESKGEFKQLVCDDLKKLIRSNPGMITGNFTNLLSSLEYAILVVEEHSDYNEYPLLFLELIEILLNESDQRSKQIGFASIRECQLLNENISSYNNQAHENLQRQKLIKIYDILFELTRRVDFVLLWDIENTVLKLASVNVKLAIQEMKEWAENGDKLQPLFAFNNLTKLCIQHPDQTEDVIAIFTNLAQNKKYRSNFWFARPLILGAYDIAVWPENKKSDTQINQLWTLVVGIYTDKKVDNPTRGLALSVLPFLANYKERYLNQITGFVKHEKYASAIWNLVYALKKWPGYNRSDNEWIWLLLRESINKKNPHINYAIRCVLNEYKDSHPDKVDAILALMENDKWMPGEFRGLHSEKYKEGLPGLIYSPIYLEPSLNNHVECRERLEVLLEKIHKHDHTRFNWVHPVKLTSSDLKDVHNASNDRHFDGSVWRDYVNSIKEAYKNIQPQYIERNFQLNPNELRYESYPAALVSAGGAVTAVDYVMDSQIKSQIAWSLGRPPGHLANNKICIFNNAALATKHAIKRYGIKRILIIDCDAHHGSHTAQTFYNSKDVLYFSIHVDGPHAAGEGNISNIGSGEGEGYTYNIVYPDFMDDDGYIYILDKLLKPVIDNYDPELILISAGFDGHFEDFLNPTCTLTERSFMHLAKIIRSFLDRKPKAKLVGVLEGGYGLGSFPNCFMHMINIIANLGIIDDDIGFVPGAGERKIVASALPLLKENLKSRISQMNSFIKKV